MNIKPDKVFNILSGHQPAYLPWLGLIHKLWLCDAFVILDCVDFEKGSFINRNKIMAPNKKPSWLTVPVKKGESRIINRICPDNSKPWQKKHLRTISRTYSKTPGFKRFFPLIENFYNKEYASISELGFSCLNLFMNLYNFKRPIIFSTSLCLKGKKDARILDMCLKLNCRTFIFGQLGLNYVDQKLFLNHSIIPVFQKYNHPVYDQSLIKSKHDSAFYSHLSALDYIMLFPDRPLDVFKNNIQKSDIHKLKI